MSSSVAVARTKKRRGPGRPAGSDGEAMRRTLLEAALRAFAAHGYDGTSVRDLARQVGVSHNLVHHHYGSKRALWQAALGHALASSGRDLLALVAANDRERDWEVANREGITGALLLFARHPAVAKIMADESARGGERLDFLYDRYLLPFARLLERLLAGAPARVKRRIDPSAALLFLFAGMTAPFALGGLAAKLDGSRAATEHAPRRPTPTRNGPTADDLQRFSPTEDDRQRFSPTEDDLQRFAATVAELIAHGLSPAGTPRRARVARRTA